jgi:cbb3-type cytochrome oxidase subunit 1
MSTTTRPQTPPPAPLSLGLGAHAPSIRLPLRFMITGLLALLLAFTGLLLRPDLLATYHYNQYIIALTHLVVLGWIGTIVMGAMYQLVPVALETKLYSERLARWQFVFHLVGFTGMVWMFWIWNLKQVGHFGTVLVVGVGLFVYNILRTLWRVPRWNVVASAVASALVWFSVAVLAGLTIAAGKATYSTSSSGPVGALVSGLKSIAAFMAHFDAIGAMHAHAHLGAVGVFLMLIVGISYKLVPMFSLSDIQSHWRTRASIWLLNAGLAGSFFAILLRSRFKMLGALVAIAGLALYGIEIVAILRARKRRTLDWGLRYFLTAIALLAPLSILAFVLAWPGLPLTALTGQLENAYGFLALAGVVSFAIIGMLYKIIPFLVWYGAYSRRIGLSKVPSLADLYSPALQMAGYWSYVAGLAVTSVAIILGSPAGVRGGVGLLGLSFCVLAANVAKMLSHLLHPRVEPLRAAAVATSPAPPLLAEPAGLKT